MDVLWVKRESREGMASQGGGQNVGVWGNSQWEISLAKVLGATKSQKGQVTPLVTQQLVAEAGQDSEHLTP